MDQSSGTPVTMAGERMKRAGNSRISTLLRTVPGVMASPDQYGDIEPVLGGWRNLRRGAPCSKCYPRAYIDGMPFSPGGSVSTIIDRAISPKDVEGIEVFHSPWVPASFGGGVVDCGVIAFWRR